MNYRSATRTETYGYKTNQEITLRLGMAEMLVIQSDMHLREKVIVLNKLHPGVGPKDLLFIVKDQMSIIETARSRMPLGLRR